MKKYLGIILAIVMLLSVAACTPTVNPADPTEAPAETDEAIVTEPVEEPTEAPSEEPAEEPTEEPSEEPTEEPTAVTGIADYITLLVNNEPFKVDLDFDGIEDTVLYAQSAIDEYEYYTRITIELGNDNGEDPFLYEVKYSYGVSAWVMDCDPEDSRLDVVVTYCQDSDDWTSAAFRVNGAGTDIDSFVDYCGIMMTENYNYSSEEGFPVIARTDILGTHDVDAYYTVTAEGFKLASPYYTYPMYEDGYMDLELIREMELDLVGEDKGHTSILIGFGETGQEALRYLYEFGSFVGEDMQPTGEKVTLAVGNTITPYATDLESWVCVKLEDGRIGRAEVSPAAGEDEWGYYINGVLQDEYAVIPYAD